MKSSLFSRRCVSTTRKLYDAVIVGGGPAGCSTALHLKNAGMKNILVLERDPSYKMCSAMLSAGGIRQQFSEPENIKLSMYGVDYIKNMEALALDDGEIPNIQFRENGYLFLGKERDQGVLLDNNKAQSACGANWHTMMRQEEMKKQFPWLNVDDLSLASFGYKNEGYFDPWMFTHAMKRKAQSLGVDFCEGSVVGAKLDSVTSGSSSYNIFGVKVVGKDFAEKGELIPSPIVVNTAGCWSGKLVADMASALHRPQGIAPVPVKPRKRSVFNVHCRGSLATSACPPNNTPLVVDPTGVWFRPEGGAGRFICGVSPSEENDPDCNIDDSCHGASTLDRGADHELFEEHIWPTLYERVPAFEELKVVASWAGFYDFNTIDQNGIVGFHTELRNMMLCTGFSGHGLQQTPGVGRAVSELLTNNGRYQTIDLTRFSFERFAKKEYVFEIGPGIV